MIHAYFVCDGCGEELRIDAERINGHELKVLARAIASVEHGWKHRNVERVTDGVSTWHDLDYCPKCQPKKKGHADADA